MNKVFLGVGHGGKDPGAVGYLKEADVNLNMALACRDYLEANGVEVMMSRTRDENDDLNEEVRECNAFNPDLAVDIHNNSGKGDGFEIYHTLNGGVGKTLAENIEAEVLAIGQNSRGIKTRRGNNGDYYGFIRMTKCPATIAEGVFVDNAADASQADTLEEQKAFGVAYAKGILKTLGITSNNNPSPAPQPAPSKSIDELADEVIAGKHGNGDARKQSLGSLYNEVQARVNQKLSGKSESSNKKSIDTIAREVIRGDWGNGEDRKNRLRNAGYDYNAIQQRVNQLLK